LEPFQPLETILILLYYSLAMAEMTTLAAAIYRKYRTTLAPGFENSTPAITARFELFYDERFPKVAVCLLLHF
jgi:hypothetical protein